MTDMKYEDELSIARWAWRSVRVRVEFTKTGWHQLSELHASPIPVFVQSVTIKANLALYIAAHEEKHIHLDTEGQEVCYQPGIYLILRKEHGIWYITEVFTTGIAVEYAPVYFWTRIKRSFQVLAARVLIRWRMTMVGSKASEAGGQFL